MSIPKEPRQIMINLMYLVLTAMLALNVSNEILHAFKIINASIDRSNVSIETKNADMMQQFEANMQLPDQRPRVEQYFAKAKLVRAESEKVYAYLESWKSKIVEGAGGFDRFTAAKPSRDGDTIEIRRQDDIDASTRLLVDEKGGDDVRNKLNTLKTFLLSQVRDGDKQSISNRLPLKVDDPVKSEENPLGTWTFGTWHNMPVRAAVTLFAKLQNDVKNSEAIILEQLFKEADAKTLKFDAITAIAVPKTSYALSGQPLEASVMFAAYNSSVNPRITASSGAVTVKDGIGTWKGTASGVGLQTVRGNMTLDIAGTPTTKQWEFDYMVGTAGGSMQLDAMNIMYVGLDNPITVSAAGYNLEDVRAEIPGNPSVISSGKGKYVVKPTTPGLVTASVSAKDPVSGAWKPIHTYPIKVKYVPEPRAKVGGVGGGPMLANRYRAQVGIEAALENFEFPVRAQVVSFDISYKIKKGGDLTPQMKTVGALFSANPDAFNIHKGLKPGDKVFIDDIRVKMPDNRVLNIGSLNFTMN